MAKITKLILFCILIISLFSRIYKLTSVPPALNQDEAVNGYDAYTLGISLKDHHGNFLPPMLESFGDWASPLITYVTVPFVKIFGLSLFSIRLVVVLLNIASVYLLFLLLNHLFKKPDIALLGTFLFSISPWHITSSRWAIPPNIVVFFLFLFLYTFFKALAIVNKKNSLWPFIISGLFAGLLTYSYPTMKLFVPIFVFALALIYLLRKKIIIPFVFLFSFAVLISPIYILTLTDSKYNARFNDVSGLGDKKATVSRYFDYFSPNFQFQKGDPDTMHQVPTIANSYLFLSFFFYLGILICLLGQFKIIKIKDIEPQTYTFLLAWLFLFPIAASITKDRNMLLRVIHGLPLVVIFSSLTFAYLWQFFKKQHTFIFITIIALFGLIGFGKYLKFYFTKYPDLVFKHFQYGTDQYSKFLLRNEDKFDKVIIDKNINQPYIYYLFYSRLKNPALISPKYVFGHIDSGIIQDLPTILNVNYKDIPRFRIYVNDSIWYVQQL